MGVLREDIAGMIIIKSSFDNKLTARIEIGTQAAMREQGVVLGGIPDGKRIVHFIREKG